MDCRNFIGICKLFFNLPDYIFFSFPLFQIHLISIVIHFLIQFIQSFRKARFLSTFRKSSIRFNNFFFVLRLYSFFLFFFFGSRLLCFFFCIFLCRFIGNCFFFCIGIFFLFLLSFFFCAFFLPVLNFLRFCCICAFPCNLCLWYR